MISTLEYDFPDNKWRQFVKTMKIQPKRDFEIDTIQHYISVVVSKIQVLMQDLEEISQRDYTSPSPIALSEILIRILSRFLDNLRLKSEKAKYQPPEDIIRTAYTINHITMSIIPQLIEAIEAADNDTSMASIIEAYEFICNQVQYGVHTIIHPIWEDNAYSSEIMQHLRKVTKSLSSDALNAIFSGAPQHFVLITYPKAEEKIILRQALIAHEIGHFIDDAILKWSESLLNMPLLNPKDIERIAPQGLKENHKSETEAKAIQLVNEAASLWIKEIVSDFLAIAIIGPAYLFAFDEISFSPRYSSPQKLSLSHPPNQLRKAIMGDWISRMYVLPVQKSKDFLVLPQEEAGIFEKVIERVEVISRGDNSLLDSRGNNQEISGDILALVYLALKNSMEKVALILWEENYKSIENEPWICKANDIVDALKMQNLLLNGLIPTELYAVPSRSPSFSAVMNCGWFHFISHENDYLYFSEALNHLSDPNQITARYLNLQNLIAKATESLHFKREYDRRKE